MVDILFQPIFRYQKRCLVKYDIMMQHLSIQPKIGFFWVNGVPLTFLYVMIKCLVGCMFWRNTCVECNCFNIKTVDQHGWDESVKFFGTIMRQLSSPSDFCGSQQSLSFFNHVQFPWYLSNSELMAVFHHFSHCTYLDKFFRFSSDWILSLVMCPSDILTA